MAFRASPHDGQRQEPDFLEIRPLMKNSQPSLHRMRQDSTWLPASVRNIQMRCRPSPISVTQMEGSEQSMKMTEFGNPTVDAG